MSDFDASQMQDALGAMPPSPPRRFFRPMTCCLGCGGLLVLVCVALVGSVFWIGSKLLVPQPLEFDAPQFTESDKAGARAKLDALKNGEVRETAFTAAELNAILMEALTTAAEDHDADPAPYRGRIDLGPGEALALKLSVPVRASSAPDADVSYLNLDIQCTPFIEKGTLQFKDITRASIGALQGEFWLKMLSGAAFYAFESAAKPGAAPFRPEDLPALEDLRVVDGKLFVKLGQEAHRSAEE